MPNLRMRRIFQTAGTAGALRLMLERRTREEEEEDRPRIRGGFPAGVFAGCEGYGRERGPTTVSMPFINDSMEVLRPAA